MHGVVVGEGVGGGGRRREAAIVAGVVVDVLNCVPAIKARPVLEVVLPLLLRIEHLA